MSDTTNVTRFEVIDHRGKVFPDDQRGRVFTSDDCRVELSFQDNGRTLKVFVTDVFTERR